MAHLRRIPALALFVLALMVLALSALAQDSVPSDLRAIGLAVAATAGGLVMSAISSAKARWFSPPNPVVETLERRIADLRASRNNILAEVTGLREGEGALVKELRRQIAGWERREVGYIQRVERLEDRIRTLERINAGRPKVEEDKYDTDADAVGPQEREEVRTHSGITPVTWSGEDTGGGFG